MKVASTQLIQYIQDYSSHRGYKGFVGMSGKSFSQDGHVDLHYIERRFNVLWEVLKIDKELSFTLVSLRKRHR